MLGRSLNFIKTIKCFGRYIPTLENKLNSVTRFISWHYQQCTNSSTLPIQKLYSSPDPKKDKQLKYIQLKVIVAHESGLPVPDPNTIKPHQWEYLVRLPTEEKREENLQFLWSMQMQKQKEEMKKEVRSANWTQMHDKRTEEIRNNKHIVYGLYANSLFVRINPKTLKRWKNRRLFRAMRHSAKLVFDCSYDEFMSYQNIKSTAKQLCLCFAANRNHSMPFDLHFCNANPEGLTMQALNKLIPTLHNKSFPLHLHTESFTEIFPKDKLVYLTPHADEDLNEFNGNDIYIIGSFVEKHGDELVSIAKAKEAGIRMARLPIEKYLQWGWGKKSLTLNQVCSIMLDVKHTGDWNKALLHVPRRKIN